MAIHFRTEADFKIILQLPFKTTVLSINIREGQLKKSELLLSSTAEYDIV